MNMDLVKLKHEIIVESPLNSEEIKAHFSENDLNKYSISIVDKDTDSTLPIFKDIQEKGYPIEFALCLKNKDFYKIDFVGILQNHLTKISCPTPLIDKIVTASQEAYSNAFLWSSLDLTPIRELRPYDFYEQIEQRLKDPTYANRYLSVYLAKRDHLFEVVFFVQGIPIKWQTNMNTAKFRGTSIILTQTDQVQVDENGRAIRLYFKDNSGDSK